VRISSKLVILVLLFCGGILFYPNISWGEVASQDLLMLSQADLLVQAEGGTFRDLFDRGSLINQHPWLGAVASYLLLSVMGYCAFFLLFFVFRGLRDHGFAISRVIGSLIVAYGVWLGGSLKFANGDPFLPNVASSFWMVFLLLLIASGFVFYRRKKEILTWFQSNRFFVVGAEGLGLVLFLFFLFVRFANPDLWHPFVGGEKPMDFAFFNAVLKSTSFPPYDPWFAGGYINYYYFGFVWISQFAKMLGLLPSIAYNVALPLLYSLTGLGIFGVVYTISPFRKGIAMLGGGFAVAMALVFGNLAQPKFLIRYIRGFFDMPADYVRHLYWNATRIMNAAPGEVTPITEIPVFTFLYGDLHAHMMAMPLAILALSIAISLAIRPSFLS